MTKIAPQAKLSKKFGTPALPKFPIRVWNWCNKNCQFIKNYLKTHQKYNKKLPPAAIFRKNPPDLLIKIGIINLKPPIFDGRNFFEKK